MQVSGIEPINLSRVREVLVSSRITHKEKLNFIKTNRNQIDKVVDVHISSDDYKAMMDKRQLVLFKPLKNSFTKAGDKKLLAKALGIAPSEVPGYIHYVAEEIESGNIDCVSKDNLEMVKTYAYRHGKKDEVATFLNYELSEAGDVLGVLYRTLQYNTGGAADYFVRPIHRMNNATLVNLYNIVDSNLTDAMNKGNISEIDKERTAEWALVRIYEIQNNQKLKNAVKLKKELG